MIEATRLTRRFGDRVAVEDVTFEVRPGEIFGLLGPNGAGKTTTLRMLAGLILPSAGEVAVAGIPLSKATGQQVRERVGLLTEAPGLWDRLTVRTNLLTYARLYGLSDPAGAVRNALARLDLTARSDDLAAELSKGLKQRVALARTLLHDPDVVLLDEPTSGLDPQSARNVREMIRELRTAGHSVIISTHNLDEAERLSDRIGVLRRRFLAVATPDALRRRMFGTRVEVTVDGRAEEHVDAAARAGATGVAARNASLTFEVGDAIADTPRIVRALVLENARILQVRSIEAPLEDIYLALVSEDEGSAGEPR
jgi:ABC-2 type transport system ATP-binding protein